MRGRLAVLLAVFLGGLIGTGLRLLADTLLPNDDTGFPTATLLVNVLGSFLLGLLVARLWGRAADWVKAGLGTGLIGSFTTFSALMVSLVAQTTHGLWLLATGYLLLSLLLGFSAAALGLRLGRPTIRIDWVDE